MRSPLGMGEVARILHVSKPSVLNWIRSGALKAFTTYGGHHRVWPADVKAFVDDNAMDIRFDFIEDRKQRVLIVDDDPVYTKLIKQLLKEEMPHVDVATTDDGYEALMMIGDFQPHLMVLDVKMPKLDGFRLLELLKERSVHRGMKVLVVSGYLDSEIRERLSRTIADYVTDKPSNIPSLVSTISDLLTRSMTDQRETSLPMVRPEVATMHASSIPNPGRRKTVSMG